MTLAIILEYSTSCVQYARIPEGIETTTEAVEAYLVDELAFRLDEIAYMLTNDSCPVYDITEDGTCTGGKPAFIIH